jgi:hypothetical protein
VKNLDIALNLEARIERNLPKAMSRAKEMMELNKEGFGGSLQGRTPGLSDLLQCLADVQ